MVFNVVKIELSFRVSILMLQMFLFYFLPSPVLHCIIFCEKAEGNELWLECSTVSLLLQGWGGEEEGEKKRLNGIIEVLSSSNFHMCLWELERLNHCCTITFFSGLMNHMLYSTHFHLGNAF